MNVAPEFDCRNAEMNPLDLVTEAKEIMDKLAVKYAILAGNKEAQQIYALLDGAIFKMSTIKARVFKDVQEAKEASKTEDAAEAEEVDNTPMTAKEIGSLVFGFLTSD